MTVSFLHVIMLEVRLRLLALGADYVYGSETAQSLCRHVPRNGQPLFSIDLALLEIG